MSWLARGDRREPREDGIYISEPRQGAMSCVATGWRGPETAPNVNLMLNIAENLVMEQEVATFALAFEKHPSQRR